MSNMTLAGRQDGDAGQDWCRDWNQVGGGQLPFG